MKLMLLVVTKDPPRFVCFGVHRHRHYLLGFLLLMLLLLYAVHLRLHRVEGQNCLRKV